MKLRHMLSSAGLAILLSACATMSVEERTAACAGTDWQKYGVNDGTLGVPSTDRNGKFSECAELGHPADLVAYQTGRSEGLISYCTVENGYTVGYEGRDYDNVCPGATEADFLQGFERGRADRPAYALSPRIGIGIGSGGRTRVGIGIGIGLFSGHYGHRY